MLALIAISGPDRGRVYRLSEEKVHLLGRLNQLQTIFLSDESVSRVHAELSPRRNRWWIADVQSTNGTFVNGRRVTRQVQVRHGDHIRLGRTVLKVDRVAGKNVATVLPADSDWSDHRTTTCRTGGEHPFLRATANTGAPRWRPQPIFARAFTAVSPGKAGWAQWIAMIVGTWLSIVTLKLRTRCAG